MDFLGLFPLPAKVRVTLTGGQVYGETLTSYRTDQDGHPIVLVLDSGVPGQGDVLVPWVQVRDVQRVG